MKNIDWRLLRKQCNTLYNQYEKSGKDDLLGLYELLYRLRDEAVQKRIASEDVIFGVEYKFEAIRYGSPQMEIAQTILSDPDSKIHDFHQWRLQIAEPQIGRENVSYFIDGKKVM